MNIQQKLSQGHGLPFEILKWALLIYTGYRSFDILMTTAPSSNLIVVAPGLLGLDLGVLVWSHLYEKKAEGNQATLAALMTVGDIIGVGLALMADALMHSPEAGNYKDFIGAISIWMVSIVIFLNFVAGVIYPMLSPMAERARKEKELNAAYDLKRKEAEHDLALAQLELANARTNSAARNLRLQATDTLYLGAGPASSAPVSRAEPAQVMAKDANYGGPLEGAPSDEEIRRVLDWQRKTGAGGATGNPKSGA